MRTDISTNSKDLELFHHGVKGMKWGVRRTDAQLAAARAGRESRSEKKQTRRDKRQAKRERKASALEGRAAKFDVSINDLKAERDALPPSARNLLKRSSLKTQIKDNTAYRNADLRDAKSIRKGGLTRNQKYMIAGGIGLAAVVGAGYMSTKIQSGEFNALKLKGQQILTGSDSIFNKSELFANKNFSPDEVLSNVVKGVNPGFRTPGGGMNCRRASMTYELRRRGFDVAATTSSMGWGQSESGLINALSPGERNVSSPDSIMSALSRSGSLRDKVAGDKRSNPGQTSKIADAFNADNIKKGLGGQPDGARGEILFNFGSFGHSMSYEIFKGVPVIFDSQKANMYSVDESGLTKLAGKWGIPSEAEVTRLDNIDLDMGFVARWATNRKKGNS